MNNTLAVGTLACALAACRGQLLELGSGEGGAGASQLTSGVTGATRIEDLTNDQANQLCSWLIQISPIPPGEGNTSLFPGYVGGSGFGCSPGADAGYLLVTWLDQSDCVANLRHSPCSSSVSSLEQCVGYFDTHYTNVDCGPGGDARLACSEYESDPSCNQTVLQASLLGCAEQLPVVVGATCEPADAGVD
jgi:hypothetical protein